MSIAQCDNIAVSTKRNSHGRLLDTQMDICCEYLSQQCANTYSPKQAGHFSMPKWIHSAIDELITLNAYPPESIDTERDLLKLRATSNKCFSFLRQLLYIIQDVPEPSISPNASNAIEVEWGLEYSDIMAGYSVGMNGDEYVWGMSPGVETWSGKLSEYRERLEETLILLTQKSLQS